MRNDGRQPNELRPIEIVRGFTQAAPGSVLIRTGGTHVFCTACIDVGVPSWRESSGKGWVTAEYEMLPGSTGVRRPRNRTKIDGRTQEIQRLIGRSLRVAVDMSKLGQYTIVLDCDVLQADGGTRTAAVNGAFAALCDALKHGRAAGYWGDDALMDAVGAVSVGMVKGEVLLDLDYSEDVSADVDCNLVMTGGGRWIEVQSTGDRATYGDDDLALMLQTGRAGIEQIFSAQKRAIEGA